MRRLQRPHGYYCAICLFSSEGNVIQQRNKKKTTHFMTRSDGLGLGTSTKSLAVLTVAAQKRPLLKLPREKSKSF